MASISSDRPFRPGQGRALADFVELLRDSCNAFNRFEDLRHMSDQQLHELGISRAEVCDELFAELYGHRKPRQFDRPSS
jgi:uncharacterized protein YjiS (DUF1127 family)